MNNILRINLILDGLILAVIVFFITKKISIVCIFLTSYFLTVLLIAAIYERFKKKGNNNGKYNLFRT